MFSTGTFASWVYGDSRLVETLLGITLPTSDIAVSINSYRLLELVQLWVILQFL